MTGRKRSSSEAGMTTRSGGSKTAKSESIKPTSKGPSGPASKGKAASKRGGKVVAPAESSFKAKALPLHVNLTHTPPAIAAKGEETASNADPGHLAAVTLLASSFKTGSYGWTGNKRFTVTLEDPEKPGEGEKVQVMLTINATVVGSKDAEKDDDGEAEENTVGEAAEEVADEGIEA